MEGELAGKVDRMRHILMEYGVEMIQALVILVFGLILLQFVMKKLRIFMDKRAKDRTRATTLLGIIYILALVTIITAALVTVGFDSRNLFRLIVMIGLGGIVILLVLRPYLPTLPFKVGNTVKVGSLLGKIEATTMVHTRMKTFDGKTVFIPNSKILNDFVINYHYTPTRRLKIDIPIRHTRDILKCKQLMESLMIEDPRVLLKPARPVVYVLNLVDGCIKMGARCWVNNPKFWITQCDLLEKILCRMDQEGITLAGRRQAIRLFHETPVLVSGQEDDPFDAGHPELNTSRTTGISYKSVSDEDEI
ncbi:MAG: mechanosensitive ion channel family protein [Desulfobacterales bacterium]|nr:mechanosensitive ion channel family protein [Desulfobacterales bacterium]